MSEISDTEVVTKEICCEDVGGPATALALNRATTQVAVAGRSVLKIYHIHEKKFELAANLRVVKSVVASCNDVAWNQVDESILASATPSGAVVTWNLNKPSFSKMDIIYQDHKRTVNKVHFHSSDPSLLLSGSQDSIKLFDLRQSEAVISYSDLSESVRDLQFSPHRTNTFIAVQDNGYVQLYDLRKKDKFEQCFPGHNGPILACDWHPVHSDVVATAGRDMSIKVWSVSSNQPTMQHCIATMESVSKIRWNYDVKSHIASCSLKRDYSINIWNILRPYIAYAKFTEPHEITTGMGWLRQMPNLISVTSNGNLYHLPMSDAYRPLDHANPVGMAINPDGDIALALGNGLLRSSSLLNQSAILDDSSSTASAMTPTNPTTSIYQSTVGQTLNSLPSKLQPASIQARSNRMSLTRRSQDSALKPRTSSRSQLDVYKCTEMNWFVKTAQEYQLSDRSLAELCDHNADVCSRLKRFQVCQTWKILKLFYANIGGTNQATTQTNTRGSGNPQQQLATSTVASSSMSNQNRINIASSGASANQLVGGTSDNVSHGSQLQIESELSYLTKSTDGRDTIVQPLNELTLDDNISSTGSEQTNGSTDEWMSHETLSYEAFQPKHDICGQVDKLIDHKTMDDSRSTSGESDNHDDDVTVQSNMGFSLKTLNTTIESEHDLKISYHLFNTKAYNSKFYEIIADVIADVLKYHVDNSDVQSAVSILIVLGDRIKNIVNERIPEVDRESWYHSYIDLLSKFQLWNVMAQVINLSPLANINSINQTSTTIYTMCGGCNKPLNAKVGWQCDRCKTWPSECSVCHGVVSGLMAWCQGCYHGGHLVHMSRWFSDNEFCPSGCGHQCELSQWM